MKFGWALLVGLASSVAQAQHETPPIFVDHGVEPGTKGCVDLDQKCAVWASQGECSSNAAWMMANCRRSCQSCQGGDRAWKLRNHLSRKYDNQTAVSNYTVNEVTVKSLRIQHVNVMEDTQMMKISGKMVLTWNDTRLEWEKAKWGLSWLNFYWIQIWTPDVVQPNAPSGEPAKISGKILAANYTGQAYMWSDFQFTAPCLFDYSYFPSDQQRCCFKIDDKKHYVVKFRVNDDAKKSVQQSATTSHSSGWKVMEAELIENKYEVEVLSEWNTDPFAIESTNCEVCVKIQRNKAYYSSEIVGPAIATAIVTLASFMVGSFWNQILLLVSSLGLQFLSNFILSTQLPPATGSPPGIVKFSTFNLVMTLILLCLVVLLLNLASLKGAFPPPHFCHLFISLLEKIIPCMKVEAEEKLGDPTANGAAAGGEGSLSGGKCDWLPFTRAIKFILFFAFLVLYVLVMISCFAI